MRCIFLSSNVTPATLDWVLQSFIWCGAANHREAGHCLGFGLLLNSWFVPPPDPAGSSAALGKWWSTIWEHRFVDKELQHSDRCRNCCRCERYLAFVLLHSIAFIHHTSWLYLGRMNLCSRKDKIHVLCKAVAAILRWEDNVDGVQGTICALTPSSSRPPRPQVGCLPASLHRACGSENGNGEAENGNDEISDLPPATTDCPPRFLIRRLRGETSIFITHPLAHSPTHPLTKTDRFQCILGPIYRCEDGLVGLGIQISALRC